MAENPDNTRTETTPGGASYTVGNDLVKQWTAQQPAANNPNPAGASSLLGNETGNEQQQPPANENTAGDDYKFLTVSFGDFVRNFKPLEWLIYGYIQKGALEMCFGPSGAGKSFVALDMGMHIAAKKMIEDAGDGADALFNRAENRKLISNWHGQTTHGGRVLYIAGEGVMGMMKRALGWAQYYEIADMDKLNNYFRFSQQSFHLDSEDTKISSDSVILGEWHKLLRELEALRTYKNFVPDLIVFDTLKANMTGDENSAQESSFVTDRAQELVNGVHTDGHRTTVLFIHHTGWGMEAKGRERGSSAWRGAMDINLRVSHGEKTDVIESKTQLTHFAVVDTIKVKDDEEQPRRYLERVKIMILDENGHAVPSPDVEGKNEETLILKTVKDADSAAAHVKIDGEDDTQRRRSSSGNTAKNEAKDTTPPPAKEESSPEDLTPDDLALPGMEEALSSDSSGVKSFAQLKKREQGGKR